MWYWRCHLQIPNRERKVSINKAMKHYLKYYDPIRKVYPFAGHARFLHYIQDLDERARIQSQCAIYLQKNESDMHLTLQELKENCSTNDPRLVSIMNRMYRYGENILGSPASFVRHKKKLLSLIERKGSPSFWFTLSLPNWYWKALQDLIDSDAPKPQSRQDWRKWFYDYQHIVDQHFLKRAEAFFDTFFGRDGEGMHRSWIWYRFDWQKRGNIHLHGMLRLEHDPGFLKLGDKVIRGRKALHRLHMIRQSKLQYSS